MQPFLLEMFEMPETCRFASLNVRGLNSSRKQYQLQRLLAKEQLDILAVQETKMSEDEQVERALRPFLLRYEVCVSHAVGVSAGCFLFLKKTLKISNLSVISHDQGRFIICDFTMSELSWRVICIYASNKVKDRELCFNYLRPYLECDRIVVFLGDFNCVCNASDRSTQRNENDSSANLLSKIVNEYDMMDVAGINAKRGQLQYTHFQASTHSRLDRIYVSFDLISNFQRYEVKSLHFTDHCLVTATFGSRARKTNNFTWELWKLNAKLLKDEQFVSSVNALFEKYTEANDLSLQTRWEYFKEELKQVAIERSSSIKLKATARERQLNRDLRILHETECENPGHGLKDIQFVKSEIEILHREHYEGAVVRSRNNKFLFGEQPTKRSLTFEKTYALAKDIYEIEFNNQIKTDSSSIEKAFVHYYTELFGKKSPHTGSVGLMNLLMHVPQLENDITEWLEDPITLGEIQKAVDELPSHKAPGPDGITSEFYKTFKTRSCTVLLNVLREAYDVKKLPPSFLKTHTILIPKSEDSVKLRCVTNYRPITLCNTDYKIFTKILTRRLQHVICQIVGEHQTCGIKGRTIQSNIHIARSVLECCSDEMEQVAMLQIDLEKAFDRVNHDVLWQVLTHVGVGKVIF